MIEGFIGKLGNAYWMIRSIYNIKGKSLALPRYIYVGNNVITLKEADESISIARKLYPESIQFSECFGRSVPLIERDSFSELLDPRNGPKRGINIISSLAAELIDRFKNELGIDSIGVTGGLLVGKPTSDIDLVIYGESNCRHAYEAFSENEVLERYTFDQTIELLLKRRQSPITFELVEKEMKKRLQGKYKGVDVYIRLVPVDPDKPPSCNRSVMKLGEFVSLVEITDSDRSFLYPCEYTALDLRLDRKLKLYSDRGRYCELLEEGDIAAVRGEFELTREEGGEKIAIYLWRNEHYLIPVRQNMRGVPRKI
ncbi:MAG: hypothetical protein JHC28_02320 [Thermoprotei archaeon]|jgi:predicted nucleotidyltransferase|nr:hypothetical protein [Thermoprotei archaeon]